MRAMGTNSCRRAMRTTTPVTGGCGANAQLGDEVLDPAEPVPVPVHERAPDHAGQVQDLDGHPWRSSSDAVRVAAFNLVDPLSARCVGPAPCLCGAGRPGRRPGSFAPEEGSLGG